MVGEPWRLVDATGLDTEPFHLASAQPPEGARGNLRGGINKARVDAHGHDIAPQRILGLVDFAADAGMNSKRGAWVHMACRSANHCIDARRSTARSAEVQPRLVLALCTASRSKLPSELKKIGRSRFAKTAKNSRNCWVAFLSNLLFLAIHSLQPRPQAFGSPVATTNISGSLRTFASRRSSSLGSSLAAIATTGRQQSAAVTHRMNLRIIVPLRAEHRTEILPMRPSTAVVLNFSVGCI